MAWQQIISRLRKSNKRTTRKAKKRGLRLESMEKRELLASDLGVISGTTFVDQGNDGSPLGDPPVLVDGAGDLVAPGTPGAMGVLIQLFEDTNNDDVFDGGDLLVGTVVSGLDGSYRFGQLQVGSFFVQQAAVPQLQTPAPVLVEVTNEMGIRTALIDDYSTTGASVTADAATPTQTASAIATEAIGGARDITVTNTAGSGQLTVFIDPTPDTLSVGSLGDATGTAVIQYDGNDGTNVLDPTGLGGVSLGGGVAGQTVDPDAGLVVRTRAENAGDDLVITVFTDGGNSSVATISLPVDAAVFQETFMRFSDFVTATGTGADFNNVGAIESSITISANNDAFVEIVETITPEIVTVDLANIQTVSLGGQIFLDNSTIGQNNAIREGVEPGLTGIAIDLYQLPGVNDVVDPDNQTPIASTTTGANGTYTFPGLIPGNYAVVVPASQFVAAAPLFGFANSTGQGNDLVNNPVVNPTDPDDNIDDDDNGTVLGDGSVASGTITLESNLEPIDDDDTDPNTNTTVDFGFFPQIDLSITKTLNDAASSIVSGGNAVFDIVVQNAGPVDATNVIVEDIFPAGLTFTGLQNASGAFTSSVTGTTVNIELGTLPSGTTATFQLTSDIVDGQTEDILNTATVSTADQVETDPTNNSDDENLDLISSDLRISKTDLTDPVNAGGQITYQIVVTNDGPDAAAGVVVRDPLPAGVTLASGDVDGATNLVEVDAGTGDIIATVGGLANGASATITLVVDVADNADSPLTNTATVTADPNTDPNPGNNSDSEDTEVVRQVDVQVTKDVTGDPIAGGNVTYSITVLNNGPSEARGVTVVDTLNTELTLVNNSFDPGTSGVTFNQSGQTLNFDVGALSSGASVTFTFDVTIDSAATGDIPNTATVATTDTDTNAANDTDTETITVGRSIDLILTKGVDLATAVPGQDQLVYTFTVTHDADSVSDALDVLVTDVLPDGLSNVVISAPTADTQNLNTTTNTVTIGFNTIPIGETRTFTVTADVDADATGTIVNPASVASTGTELDNTNNDDTATTTLNPDFDVVVTKDVSGSATPAIGETVAFTVTVQNEGPSTATGVVLSDVVPAGLTFDSGTLDGVGGTLIAGTVSFPAITLAPNQTVTGTLNFTVDNDASGTITNTASVPDLSAAGENDVANNSDGADITIAESVDLTIAKTVSASESQVGGSLTYTVTVNNSGPSIAQAVTVVDTLPSGVNFVSGTGPNGEALSAVAGVITVDGGDLASGGSFSFTVNGTVAAGATGTQTNTAVVSTTTPESNTGNNTATATTSIDPITSSIAGTVYIDANNNGVQDVGEAGIPGVELQLTGTDTLGNPVNLTETTNAAGDYLFAQLAAGTYQVTQVQPAGFSDGAENAGTGATATVGDDVFSNLGLGVATSAAEFDFGELNAPLSKRRFLASARAITETT